MTESVNGTAPTWVDPDDAPELTEDFFARAEIKHGDKVIRAAQGTLTKPRGRPRLDNPKKLISLRLDSDVVDRLRDSGPGWQSRVNEILRKATAA